MSYRGESVAEVRPIEQAPQTIEVALEQLRRRGVVVPPSVLSQDF